MNVEPVVKVTSDPFKEMKNTGCPWGPFFSESQWLWQYAAECRADPQEEQDRLVAVLRSIKESGVLKPGLLLNISSLPSLPPRIS